MLILVGCLYSWGAYKRMVKYETNNGDLAVATRQRSPLNFTWPWLERRSAVTGRQSFDCLPGPCDSHSSRAFCSRPSRDYLGLPTGYGGFRNPILPPNRQPNIAVSCMPSHESHNRLCCFGLGVESYRLVRYMSACWCLYSWGAYLRIGTYIHKEPVRTERVPIFTGCLLS